MARRRLLTILAASAVLSTAFVGPAAALDVVEETGSETVEVVTQVEEATAEAVEPVEDVVDATPVEEPVDEVAEVVDETVSQRPTSSPSSEPEPEPEPRTRSAELAPSSAAADTDDDTGADVVAAGRVGDAPSLEARADRGTPLSRPNGALPAMAAPADPATDSVEAPLVAPPPADDEQAPSVLALPATTPVPAHDSPALALIALGSLVAAGAWTLGEAKATGTVTSAATVTA